VTDKNDGILRELLVWLGLVDFCLCQHLFLVGLLFESWEPVVWLVVGEIAEFSGVFSRTIDKSYRTFIWLFLPYGFLR